MPKEEVKADTTVADAKILAELMEKLGNIDQDRRGRLIATMVEFFKLRSYLQCDCR